MALSYQNVYLGTDEEGVRLKAEIKRVADREGLSASEFCRWAIEEKIADVNKNGGTTHDAQRPVR